MSFVFSQLMNFLIQSTPSYLLDLVNLRTFVDYLSPIVREVRSMSTACIRFYIPMQEIDWIRVYNLVETSKARLNIHYYIIDLPSIEEGIK